RFVHHWRSVASGTAGQVELASADLGPAVLVVELGVAGLADEGPAVRHFLDVESVSCGVESVTGLGHELTPRPQLHLARQANLTFAAPTAHAWSPAMHRQPADFQLLEFRVEAFEERLFLRFPGRFPCPQPLPRGEIQ